MPGVTVNLTTADAGSGVASDTGKWLVAAITQRGRTTIAEVIRNMADFAAKLGTRQTNSYLYDCAEAFFRKGGSTIVVGRIVGPAAAPATVTLQDAATHPALTVKANGPGAWGNGATGGLSVEVAVGSTGGTFVLKIRYGGALVETSPDLADAAAAIDWATHHSSYVVITDPGATADPAVVAATNLAAGADDITNVTTTQWQSGLALFTPDLGAGQVSAGPGITTTAVQQAVLDHCDATGRTPVLDGPNSITPGDFSAAVTALSGNGRKRGALCGPWEVIPGLTSDTTRTIPLSATVAATLARNDGNGTLPKVATAPAGDDGYTTYSLGLTVAWDRATIDSLNAAGVLPARIAPDGRTQLYGDRTMANIQTERAWLELSSSRLFMYVEAQGKAISEHYVFKPLDAEGRTIARYSAELTGLMMALRTAQMIFNDPQTAVDTASVNSDQTRKDRKLLANLTVQPTEGAEDVVLNVAAQAA